MCQTTLCVRGNSDAGQAKHEENFWPDIKNLPHSLCSSLSVVNNVWTSTQTGCGLTSVNLWINQFFRNLHNNTEGKCWKCIVLSFSFISGFLKFLGCLSFSSSFVFFHLLSPAAFDLRCYKSQSQTGPNGTEIMTMYSISVYTDRVEHSSYCGIRFIHRAALFLSEKFSFLAHVLLTLCGDTSTTCACVDVSKADLWSFSGALPFLHWRFEGTETGSLHTVGFGQLVFICF